MRAREWKRALDKWPDELESGEYRQGSGKLRTDDDRFCCLGVFADIAIDGYWDQTPLGDYAIGGSYLYLSGSSARALELNYDVDILAEELDIDGAGMGVRDILILANDGDRDFNRIAAALRAARKKEFTPPL